MQKKYLYSISVLLCLTISSVGYFVYAAPANTSTKQEISDLEKEILKKKEKIAEIEKSMAAYKDKIAQTRTESISLSNQMALLDNKVTQVELDISSTEETIETLSLEIARLELIIAEKKQDIARQKELLKKLVKTLYLEDDRSFLEVIASFESFSNFYDQVKYLETIEQDLGDSSRTLRMAKESLEAEQVDVEAKQQTYEELKVTLNEKKKDLEDQLFVKEQLLSQTQASELTYKTLVGNLKSQYQAIESDITSVEQQIRNKYKELDTTEPDMVSENGTMLMSWPAPSRYITAYFHDQSYPYRNVFEHSGLDIRAAQGTAIKAAAPGYVARARRCASASCYSYIMIVHSGGISTVYGHLSGINVIEDQFIGRGEVIGYSGGTPGTAGAGPFVTGPHLHFEVRKNGIPINPLPYLSN